MKWGKLTVERRRVYTFDNADIDHEMVRQDERDKYIYNDFAARKTLTENQFYQWDCAAFGFPDDMIVQESDSPDTFDVVVFWGN